MATTHSPAPSGPRIPQLRNGLDISASGQDWTVSDAGGRIFRVSADVAALLKSVDGVRTPPELAGHLLRQTGRQWTSEAVTQALEAFSAKGWIEDGTIQPGKPRRIRFVPPLTLQIAFFSPAPFLSRMKPTLDKLIGTRMVVVYALIMFAGVVVLAASSRDVWHALTTPLPLSTYLAVIVAMMLSTMLHEMGHGAALTAFGGKPRQIGFMLFYLTPAFFCDVSDGWRLDSKWKRVSIALAGIVTQGVLAGTASLLSLAAGAPEIRTGLLVYAVLGYTSGIINLVPFVKLDGYIALMSYLNISHLRDKSLRDARRMISRGLFGHATPYELPPLRRFKAYGVLCMLFPAYLIITALSLWLDVIAKFGGWGAVIALLIVALVLGRAVAGFINVVKEGWDPQRSKLRIVTVTVLLTAATAVSAAYVQIPATIEAGFVNDASGPGLVFDDADSVPALRVGQVVEIYGSGLIGARQIGTLSVEDAHAATRSVPLDAIAPVTIDGARLNAVVIPLKGQEASLLPSSGTARIHLGNENPYQWFSEKYIQPAMAAILGGPATGQT